MKAGKVIGISVFVIGLIALGVFYFFFLESNRVPKIFIASPALIIVGLAMIIFPGGDIKVSDLDHSSRLQIWGPAPLSHKIAWIISLLIGAIVSVWGFIYFFD